MHFASIFNIFRAILGALWWSKATTDGGFWAVSSAGASDAPNPTCPGSAPEYQSSGSGFWPTPLNNNNNNCILQVQSV